MKKNILLILMSVLVVFVNVNKDIQAGEAKTRIVVVSKGNRVEVPYKVTKVANLWNSANEILVQLGAGDVFVGGSVFLKTRPWMIRVFPRAKEIAVISQGGVANSEAVLALDPDFTISIARRADALIAIGEPVIQLEGDGTIEGLLKQISIIAEALGPEYRKSADKFFTYFRDNLEYVAQRTADIPDNKRMKILHGSTSSTVIDGSLSGSLLRKINTQNAFPHTNSRAISHEAILKANPDIIIVSAGRYSEYEKFVSDPIYSDIKAVKNNRVYINPAGMFLWDAFSGEIALEVLWLAKTVYPERFQDLNLHGEVRNFYKSYFDYYMSDEEIKRLLAGKDPDGNWQ